MTDLDKASTRLDTLPDDCILSILDCLDDQRALMNLTLVSKRFNSLIERKFRGRFVNCDIQVRDLPSMRIQKFGTAINALILRCHVSDRNVGEICDLCPNLRKLHFKQISGRTISRSFFRRMLSQLHELEIQKLTHVPKKPWFQHNLNSALQCCENLVRLSLGRFQCSEYKSNFETIFLAEFPSLRN